VDRILIAGCGYVGSRLAGALAADGHRVTALRRSEAPVPEGVQRLRADLLDPEALDGLPAALGGGPDAVVYTAGPDRPEREAYRRAYVEGLDGLIRALERAGCAPRRLLFTTSTAVYGQSDGEWVDETSPTRPTRWTGEVLLEAEARALAAPWPATVVRLGGIYGPGRTGLLERVRSGRAVCRPGPPHYTNRIHRDDAAGALRHLLSLDRAAGVVLGVDGHPGEECEVLRFLARELGAPPPRRAADDEDLPPRRAGSKRCSNARLRSSGYRFEYPSYREGYADVIRGLRAEDEAASG